MLLKTYLWREEFTLGELCELLGLVEKGGG